MSSPETRSIFLVPVFEDNFAAMLRGEFSDAKGNISEDAMKKLLMIGDHIGKAARSGCLDIELPKQVIFNMDGQVLDPMLPEDLKDFPLTA